MTLKTDITPEDLLAENTTAVITLDLNIALQGIGELTTSLDELHRLFTTNIEELAMAGIERIQRNTLARLDKYGPDELEVVGGLNTNDRLKDSMGAIRNVLAQPPVLAGRPGVVGFGSIADLDKILINKGKKKKPSVISGAIPRETRESPYDKAWLIAEFGTGVYAVPKLRSDEGHSKVPGGNGAWYWNPNTKSPIVLGQKGGHFLFPERAKVQTKIDDLEDAASAMLAKIQQIFERGRE